MKTSSSISKACALFAVTIGGAASAQSTPLLDQAGAVAESDARDDDGNAYDEYTLTLPAVTRVRINATRVEPFDPNIEVLSPDGQRIAYDDDSAGELNALARFTTSAAGQYRVRVRGLGGSMGQYRIVAQDIGPGVAPPPPRRLIGDQGGRFTETASPTTSENSYYADYRVRLNAGQEIVLNLDSDDFDAYLSVFAEGDLVTPLGTNDDSNNTRNSTLVFRAPNAGNYIVRASQLGTSAGAYRLRLRRITAW